jgi:hypothetical protein
MRSKCRIEPRTKSTRKTESPEADFNLGIPLGSQPFEDDINVVGWTTHSIVIHDINENDLVGSNAQR